MHSDNFYAAIEVKSEEMPVHDVFPLRKKRAHELATELTGCCKVVGAEPMLLFTCDFVIDNHRLRREKVIIVALMPLGQIV